MHEARRELHENLHRAQAKAMHEIRRGLHEHQNFYRKARHQKTPMTRGISSAAPVTQHHVGIRDPKTATVSQNAPSEVIKKLFKSAK